MSWMVYSPNWYSLPARMKTSTFPKKKEAQNGVSFFLCLFIIRDRFYLTYDTVRL